MLDFVIFAVTFAVALIVAIIYLYPVSKKKKKRIRNLLNNHLIRKIEYLFYRYGYFVSLISQRFPHFFFLYE